MKKTVRVAIPVLKDYRNNGSKYRSRNALHCPSLNLGLRKMPWGTYLWHRFGKRS